MKEKNVFIIRWYGPFSSRQTLKECEYEQKECFYLYLFQGKRRSRKKYKYYCGMTFDRKKTVACVAIRMGDANHHIHQFEDERPKTIAIWVGTFANVSHPKKTNVRLCEKTLTSVLTNIELDEKEHENKTNKKPPKETVYIINEWFDINKDDDGYYVKYKSRSKDVIPNKIPDVMCYFPGYKPEPGSLYWTRKLKYDPIIS